MTGSEYGNGSWNLFSPSNVVHGSKESIILNIANKFIETLRIDHPSSQHSLGRLSRVANKVEDWLAEILFYLASLPIGERPYKKVGGWEELLWGKDLPEELR